MFTYNEERKTIDMKFLYNVMSREMCEKNGFTLDKKHATIHIPDTAFSNSGLRNHLTFKNNWDLRFGSLNHEITEIDSIRTKKAGAFRARLERFYIDFYLYMKENTFEDSIHYQVAAIQDIIKGMVAGYSREIFSYNLNTHNSTGDQYKSIAYIRYIKLLTPCYVMLYDRMKQLKYIAKDINVWFYHLINSNINNEDINRASIDELIGDCVDSCYQIEYKSLVEKHPLHDVSNTVYFDEFMDSMRYYVKYTLPRAAMLANPYTLRTNNNLHHFIQVCITKRVWEYCSITHKEKCDAGGIPKEPRAEEDITTALTMLRGDRCELSVEERRYKATHEIVKFLNRIGHPEVATDFWNVAYLYNK